MRSQRQGAREGEATTTCPAMATARAIAAAATALAAVLVALLAPAARGVDRSEFPPGFLFGAATSAYQVSQARVC